ncbi:MAG: SAM-dependent methyltransferase [Candidatus Daviesbacteria bacterium]|nr:SAM-dependent methyltransferase [Candidatus Daviesbacteria bacterium]
MPQNDKDRFVSRGGIKLQTALDQFKIDVRNKVVLDVGSSTGGFVDCLLQNNAKKVYSVDTAYGELAWKLRNDPKVVVMERTNVLFPDTWKVGFDSFQVDIVTIDAGWTRLELVLPVVKKFLKPDGLIIALLKPHYEADKRDLVKGVLPSEVAERVKEEVIKRVQGLGFKVQSVIDSPILGGAGNREYLLNLTFSRG